MAQSILDIKSILDEYSEDVQNAIAQEAVKVAKTGVSKLKNTSPKRTGKYAKGWRSKTDKRKGKIECTIYNGSAWQLTHLLEKSHLLRNGKKSIPKVHIYPVEQSCIKEYETNVENIIKNGV